jgi:hypothetical protein
MQQLRKNRRVYQDTIAVSITPRFLMRSFFPQLTTYNNLLGSQRLEQWTGRYLYMHCVQGTGHSYVWAVSQLFPPHQKYIKNSLGILGI